MGARGSGYCAQQTFWIRLPGRPEAERNASEGTTYLKKTKANGPTSNKLVCLCAHHLNIAA